MPPQDRTGIQEIDCATGKVVKMPGRPAPSNIVAEPSIITPVAAPIEFKSVAKFCDEYEPLSYAVEPIIRSASLYTLTAKTGAGKTGFMIAAGLAVATGRQ